MFDTIAGLPVHPLVVHAAVVLVPLACVGLILVVAVPTLREKYAVLVLIGLVVGTLCVLVAESSGVALAERVGGPGAHATWGERLKVGSLVTCGLASAWFIGTRRVGARWVGALGVIASVAAVVTVALTVMTGHSGASSVCLAGSARRRTSKLEREAGWPTTVPTCRQPGPSPYTICSL